MKKLAFAFSLLLVVALSISLLIGCGGGGGGSKINPDSNSVQRKNSLMGCYIGEAFDFNNYQMTNVTYLFCPRTSYGEDSANSEYGDFYFYSMINLNNIETALEATGNYELNNKKLKLTNCKYSFWSNEVNSLPLTTEILQAKELDVEFTDNGNVFITDPQKEEGKNRWLLKSYYTFASKEEIEKYVLGKTIYVKNGMAAAFYKDGSCNVNGSVGNYTINNGRLNCDLLPRLFVLDVAENIIQFIKTDYIQFYSNGKYASVEYMSVKNHLISPLADEKDVASNIQGTWQITIGNNDNLNSITFKEDKSFTWKKYSNITKVEKNIIEGKYNIDKSIISIIDGDNSTTVWIVSEIDKNYLTVINNNGEKISYTKSSDEIENSIKNNLEGTWGFYESKDFSPTETYKFEKNTFTRDNSIERTGLYEIIGNQIYLEESSNNTIPSTYTKVLTIFTCSNEDLIFTNNSNAYTYKHISFEGNGNEDSPYLIKNESDFNNIRHLPNSYYKQIIDLDLSKLEKEYQTTSFRGNYNGNGFKIENIPNSLFSLTNAIIRNVRAHAKEPNISSAIIATWCSSESKILYCYVSGNIETNTNSYIGGIANIVEDYSEIMNSISTCKITGKSIGGLCGQMWRNSNLNNCIVLSDLIAEKEVGGITEYVDRFCSIRKCISLSNISGNIYYTGGITKEIGSSGKTQNNIALNASIGTSKYRICSNSFVNDNIKNNYSWNKTESGERGTLSLTYWGIDAPKSEFWGASTKQSFWIDKLGWTDFDENWEFRPGYNLPQLKGLPSVPDPEYLTNATD